MRHLQATLKIPMPSPALARVGIGEEERRSERAFGLSSKPNAKPSVSGFALETTSNVTEWISDALRLMQWSEVCEEDVTTMCGRYLFEDDDYSDIGEMLNALARGEIFPTNIAPVYTDSGASAVKWGFPHWKNSSVIINARAETALQKNMFRKPLLERRCVVPSNGFYEWDRTGGGKKKDKYLLRLPGARMLYMAGMVNIFRDAEGGEYGAFVILTTSANNSVSQIHDRMPVILAPDERDMWVGDTDFMDYALRRPGPELRLERV